jgi:FkbM family methyltransferase
MGAPQIFKRALRGTVERAGYHLTHRSVLPLGVDPLWDIQRLAARHGLAIRTAFDIGAHVGETATEYLQAFPEAQVHSFEPHPNSFSCLARIKADRLFPHRLAMSDRRGEAEFFVRSDVVDPTEAVAASMNNSLVQERQFGLVEGNYSKSIKVECDTIDHFCRSHGIETIDLLKIDVEGHEAAVLDGAADVLASGKVRFAFVEYETILPIPGASGGALSPVAERLEPLGFRLVASYPNNMVDRPLYVCFNALFLHPGQTG